jgi:hypothetical protein
MRAQRRPIQASLSRLLVALLIVVGFQATGFAQVSPAQASSLPQSTLTVSSSNGTYGESLTLTTSGGSGSGAISYTLISGNCAVSGDVLSNTSAGNCVVTATKASDATYAATTSVNKTIVIAKKLQVFSYSIVSGSGAFKYGDTYTVTMNFPADAVAGASSWNVFKASTAWGINSGGDPMCTGGTILAGAVTCTFNTTSLWPSQQALNITGLHVRFNGSTNYEAFSHLTDGTKIDLSGTSCGLVFCPSTSAVKVQATNKSISFGAASGDLQHSITNGANGATTAWGIGCTSTYQTGDAVGTYPIVCTGTTRPSGAPTPVTNAWVIANTNYQDIYDGTVAFARYSLSTPTNLTPYPSAAEWWKRGSYFSSDTYSNLTFGSGTLTVSRVGLATPTISGTTAVSSTSISVAFNGNNTAPAAASYTLRIYQSDGTTLVGAARTNYVSGTTITGLTQETTYKVSVTAIGDVTNTSSSSASSLATVSTPVPTTHVVTFNKQNNTAAATETVTQGFAATTPTAPTWYGYNFKGWSETSSGAVVDVSTVTISGAKTFYAIWEQKSLAGLTGLSSPERITADAVFTRTISSSLGANSTSVKVPAGALPSTFEVKVYTLLDDSFAKTKLGVAGTYIISQVVAWADTAAGSVGNIQDTAPGKPIEMTITSPDIKAGAKVYSVLGDSSTLLATATQNGSVTVTFSEDPVIIVEAAPPVNSAPGGSSPDPVVIKPVVQPIKPVANTPKGINFAGFNPNSWALTKAIKASIDRFFKKVASPTKVSCVGNTMGPKILKSYQQIAERRAEVVCDYIANNFAETAEIVISGVPTKFADTRYRRTRVGLSY